MILPILYFVLWFTTAAAAQVIPDYVLTYAPLVYLDVNELYLPSDIGQQVANTNPAVNLTELTASGSNDTLYDLSKLNAFEACTVSDFDACPLYLTSKQDVTTDPRPSWLYGVLPDDTGYTRNAVACAVIVNDHGDGTVDAFYMYFYAFNLGEDFYGEVLGNHIGDWEHTMTRFVNGQPQAIWFSQHDAGEVFAYSAVQKNGSRPVVYSAIGSHANFAVAGLHSRTVSILTLNDTTSKGPLWDPVKNAYFYDYTVSANSNNLNGTFTPITTSGTPATSTPAPVAWLYYLGRWGDKQYPDNHVGQLNEANVSWAYEDGPTGPLDKQLQRQGTCPDQDAPCTTQTVLPATSGSSISQTVTRSYTTQPAASGTAVQAYTTASAGSSRTTSTGMSTSPSTSTSPSPSPSTGAGRSLLDRSANDLMLQSSLAISVLLFLAT